MSIVVDIDPSVENELRKRATEAGLTTEDYSRLLILRGLNATEMDARFEESVGLLEAVRGKVGVLTDKVSVREILYGVD